MKTLIVCSVFPALSETFVRRQVRHLDADVLCRTHDAGLREQLGERARVYSLCEASVGPAAPPQTGCAAWRRAAGLLRDPLKDLRNWWRPYTWGKEMDALLRSRLEQTPPDVVLAQFAPNGLNAMRECGRRGIPCVVHFHGYDATRLMRWQWYRESILEMFHRVQAVICPSRFIHGVLLDAGCPAAKLHRIPCGVPTDEFLPAAGVAAQPARFLAVSRLVEGKGLNVTLRAFSIVRRLRPGARLTVVGEGPVRSELESYIQRAGLEGSAVLKGGLVNGAVKDLMSQSSVFVQASLTAGDGWREGFGVSLAEALASGLPAVATRSGGMVDLVRHGESGFLFEEGDARQMARHMLRLADDPDLRLQMGLAGRRHVEKEAGLKESLRRLEAVLREAAARPPSRW